MIANSTKFVRPTFRESDHSYWCEGERYSGVTTFIGFFKNAFDAEYWSLYKAYERLYIQERGQESFNDLKRSVGWKNLVNHFESRIRNKAIVLEVQQQILKEWEKTKDAALEKGKAVHKIKEDYVLSKKVHVVKETKTHTDIAFTGKTTADLQVQGVNNLFSLPDGIYTELLIWNNSFKIAGQADKVIIETLGQSRFVDVHDYKTNKELPKESFNDPVTGYRMMKPPLQDLMDCTFIHYELQISFYMFMLEAFGFIPRAGTIEHTTDGGKIHHTRYLKTHVEKALLSK